MKLKLAIIYGALIWLLIHVIQGIFKPIFNYNLPYFNMLFTVISIVVTGFFGILYIRNIDKNEVDEGILAGIVFGVVYLILDFVCLILFPERFLIPDYPLNVASMIVINLLLTTFLGYLAQMDINLK